MKKLNLQAVWCQRQVDRALGNILYWSARGYEFTESQKEQLAMLDAVINDKPYPGMIYVKKEGA